MSSECTIHQSCRDEPEDHTRGRRPEVPRCPSAKRMTCKRTRDDEVRSCMGNTGSGHDTGRAFVNGSARKPACTAKQHPKSHVCLGDAAIHKASNDKATTGGANSLCSFSHHIAVTSSVQRIVLSQGSWKRVQCVSVARWIMRAPHPSRLDCCAHIPHRSC